MVVIRAVSFKGRPAGREISGRFAEAGGTIGRGESNTLVLPDPERYISRTHATVSFQAGGFVITDTGTKNPVLLNGRPLGQGSQARLSDGDTIKLGDYILEVTFTAPRAAAPASSGRAGGGAATPAEVPVARAAAPAKDDPLALFGGGDRGTDPFADLLGPAERPAPRAEPAIPPSPSPPPPAWPEIPPARLPEAGSPDDPLAGIRGAQPSIDELFSLKTPGGSADLLAPDVQSPMSRGAGAASSLTDPLEALGAPPRPIPPPSVRDDGEELFAPYAPPAATPDPALQPRPEPAAPPPVQPPAPTPVPAAASSGATDEELLRALLRGAGIASAQALKTLTPETMESVGKLLRAAVQGTLDLLRARGATKSEMRADVTMIVALDNNPLKFSPTVEAALIHLLAPPVHGFMPPVPAMKDAYDDLRAHQLGFLAGMRAALEEVLARFAPEELEERLSDPGVLDSLLPMNRRAKLWDLFVERYGEVASDAREDFNASFGKAFLRAYEAQVKRLRSEGKRG